MRISSQNLIAFVVALVLATVSLPLQAAEVKDAESASHAHDAAQHQVEQMYEFPGFKVVQINLGVLSHYSYLLVSAKDALVIDPDRDIGAYLELAKKENVSIRGVFLTHSHADFVAGHLELAKAVGCPIYQNKVSGAGYKIEPLQDGSMFRVGTTVLKAIETPGHTPDGLTLAAYSNEADASPKALFTGDTLFVGSVGRPDLLEGQMTAATLASMLYDSWFSKLAKLPDSVVVLPAHGAGSLCGAHLSDKPSSTIGEERAANPYLQNTSRSAFIASVLQDLPEAPQYFKHNAAMNRQGPELIDWDSPLPAEMKPTKDVSNPAQHYAVDLRDAEEYAASHVPNSVNIGLRGRLETWVGIMVPWNANLVLIGNSDQLKEAITRLHRVGYKAAVLTIDNWSKASLPLAKNEMAKPVELHKQMQEGKAPLIIDVRLPSEWMGLRIGQVVNLPLSHLGELSAKLDPAQPVVTVCNSAYRSSMAVGLLEAKGFQHVASLDGGSEAWIAAGLPVYGASTAPGAVSAPARRDIRLAERISASELKRLMMDLPGTFDLVDVRPPEHFADFSLPGSVNAHVADLLNKPGYLTGAGPLIIADRDGSVAMMVGGVLSQKTERQIKVLYGGVEAYWRETELKPAVSAVPLPGSPGSSGTTRPPTGAPPQVPSPPQSPSTPRKKSAGC
jgi:glyoxylase-like metal-dependent hydrolase (beta-lactamase superfamily II)/rhodanese-related sulfurtransferase